METPNEKPAQPILNDPKVINGWALFDWANSSYALVITAAIFPAYFVSVTFDQIQIAGFTISNSSLYAFAISLAYLIIASLSPILSGIADYGGRKKSFLKFFTTMGSMACISLFFFQGMSEDYSETKNLFQLSIGTVAFIIATIGFAGGLVFYNSYLPEIVSEDKYDNVSARGFAFGYVGSVILLLANLIIILNPTWFGIPEDSTLSVRLAFIMVGLWWIGFAQITFRRLPDDPINKPKEKLFSKGFEELQKVWSQVKGLRDIKRFLIAFFCYSAGAQTVIFLASTFAEKELQFETSQLIFTILILQIVGIAGAYLFAKLSNWKGNIFALIFILSIWIVICVLAYFVYATWQFYLTAALVGLVMGGVQSLSRSTYSKLIPAETDDTTSYFSFYDVLEKSAIVTGTFSFGFIEQVTGNLRNSVLALILFFVVGLIILWGVKIRGQQQKSIV